MKINDLERFGTHRTMLAERNGVWRKSPCLIEWGLCPFGLLQRVTTLALSLYFQNRDLESQHETNLRFLGLQSGQSHGIPSLPLRNWLRNWYEGTLDWFTAAGMWA
jgi:hypothetical protein